MMIDDKVMGTWPKDFLTGLPVIPQGDFTDFGPYKGKLSDRFGRADRLPVLRGRFYANKFDFTPGLPAHCGWGSVQLGPVLALTFRLQVGPNVLYWFANAADRHVWSVLDQWAAAGCMQLAPEFDDGRAFVVRRNFKMAGSYTKLRARASRPSEETRKFMAHLGHAFIHDELRTIASTDIAAYPTLEHAQACMVVTPETQGMAVQVSHEEPGPEGPVAAAVAALAQAMLRPNERRH